MDSTRKPCYINDDELEVDDRTQDNSQQMHHDTGQTEEMEENGRKSLIMEIYPWIPQFKKMCRSALLQMSMSSLKSLMTYYSRNVRPSVNECRTKPLRAEKLKDCIGETLLFFLYYYREIEDVKDRDGYMILMSDLLAMYVDMELKASKKGNEHSSKISARLSSCLHVYLENSAEHLLDTLLKVHFMTHNYHEIMDPVVTKIFKSIEEHPSSSVMYVRYLLAYRLWKKLNKDVAVRNRINAIAITSLGTAPPDFPSFILETVLPKVPKTQKLSTKLLLLNKFEVEKSCEEFLNFCKEERGRKLSRIEDQSSSANTITVSLPEDNNDSRESIIHNNVSNVTNGFATSLNNSSIDKSCHEKDVANSKRPSANSIKVSAFRKLKKSNDIVIIDLTSDSVTEKIMRKKKTRRKLIWLEEAKRRLLGTKTTAKKDSATEDEPAIAQQPKDPSKLDSPRVEDTNSHCQPIVEEIAVDIGNEKRTIEKDSSLHAISSESMTNEATCTVANALVDKGHNYAEWRVLEMEAEKREADPAMVSSITEVSSIEREISTVTIGDSTSDEYFKVNKNDDARESASREETAPTKMFYERAATPEDKTLAGCTTKPVDPTVKVEPINDEPNEIINETVTEVSSCVQVSVVEYASEISLRTSCDEECNTTVSKVREAEFQENIDGLSLLASVSQSVSQLTTESSKTVNSGELIKVKNYASLVEPNTESVQEPDTSSSGLPFFGDSTSSVVNRVVGIYPEDAMDKVAYQVEVTSTDEIDPYEGCDRSNGLVPLLTNNPQVQSSNVVPLESTTQAEKEDAANVILNGETVVLFQKSPNSNLYIINKAVENRDHVDEVATAHREMTEHANETGAFSYEIYDNLYRSQASSYDISSYNRELSSHQESRRTKQKVKINTTGDAKKRCDSSETTKSGKTKTLDVVGEKSRGKRKSSTNSGLSRRRRIKQEYESCPNNMSDHMKSDYGIQDCPQEHVDPTRSIHIPVAHSNPLSPMYTKFPPGPELYLPCHKNCNSITRGLTVNPTQSLHSHGGKNSASGNSHRSCLNCAYGIVTHCSECIIPSGETRGTTMDANSYYLPIHSNGQNPVVQERGRATVDDSLSRIYDDQLLCKLEQSTVLVDGKPLENVGVKCEPSEIYRAELDNKLPLKKRFKAIMSFNELPIKREKIVQSYPGTPMLSIAAVEAARDEMRTTDVTNCDKNPSLDLSLKMARADSHQAREMIRRDYCKDTVMSPPPTPVGLPNGCHGNTVERKRKRRSAPNSHYYEDQETPTSPQQSRLEDNYEKVTKSSTTAAPAAKLRGTIAKPGGGTTSKRTTMTPTKTQARPSEKVKEPGMAPMKNSSRQTRSSKRNVPKVNYIYTDGDSDWNPSGSIGGNGLVAGGEAGGSKRKRKKTGR